MVIVAGSLYQQTYRTLFSVINSSFTGSVYPEFPLPRQGKKLSFPLAVLDNPENLQNRITFDAQGLHSSDMTVPVTIYSSSSEDIDSRSDQINAGIKNNMPVLLSSGLHTWTVVDGGGGTDIIGDTQRVHNKTILLGFNVSV